VHIRTKLPAHLYCYDDVMMVYGIMIVLWWFYDGCQVHVRTELPAHLSARVTVRALLSILSITIVIASLMLLSFLSAFGHDEQVGIACIIGLQRQQSLVCYM
jgi:hypothetical protein